MFDMNMFGCDMLNKADRHDGKDMAHGVWSNFTDVSGLQIVSGILVLGVYQK